MNAVRQGNAMRIVRISCLLAVLLAAPAYAGDPAFWGHYAPEIHAWFPTVMQPNTRSSCCGEADAFEALAMGKDAVGNILLQVNDGKGIIPDYSYISSPPNRIQANYGNPLGILIVFISMQDHKTVLCLVPAIEG